MFVINQFVQCVAVDAYLFKMKTDISTVKTAGFKSIA